MGDPRKTKKKYSKPSHPWRKERIDEENALVAEYGLKNKKEVWKEVSFLKNATRQAKTLVTLKTKQAELEKDLLLKKLVKYGLLSANSSSDDVLNISTKSILDRRLQSLVFRKGLAKSMKQARQLIVHGHIFVNGKKLSAPSYMVTVEEERTLAYAPNSDFSKEDHPERQVIMGVKKEKEAKADAKADHKKTDSKSKKHETKSEKVAEETKAASEKTESSEDAQ